MVLPGAQKTFEQFRADDALCQFYARQGVGGQTPTQTAMDSGTASAVAGTAIGAGSGLLLGGAAGTGTYESSAYALQNRYDITYVQCMYAKGNQVPVPAAYRDAFSRYQPPPPLPNSGAPPPPAPPGAKPPLPPPGTQPPPNNR